MIFYPKLYLKHPLRQYWLMSLNVTLIGVKLQYRTL